MPVRHGREHIPLLSGGVKKGAPRQLIIKRDREKWEEEEDAEDKARDRELFAENMNRGASLLFQDTLILVLHLIQLFCVAQSLGHRWVWPYRWVKRSYFVLIINLDVWDFLKVQTGVHEDVQNHHVPSGDMPVNYWIILLAWGLIVFAGFLTYVAIYAVIQYKHDVLMLSQIAKLQWVYIVILQCLAIPFGIATGRVFHCNDKNKVDVDNDLDCFSSHHWAYIVPVCALWILFYVLFTIWLIYKTRIEMLSMPSKRHEAYLQLKEIEFVHGLDVDWMVGHFHVFSSFRKWGSYYRAAAHILITLVVISFAGMHNMENAQAIVITCLVFIAFLAACVVRPYRVPIFNFALCWSLFCVFGAFLTGAFISSFDNTTVNSVYLTQKYMTYILTVVTVLLFVVGIIFPVLYIVIRHNQRACCPCCLRKEQVKGEKGLEWKRRWEPVWPALSSSTLHKLSPETRKFIKAILRGRVISEKILLMPPLFAPAHELARHIHVINAYCREAEYLQDPMQSTLWDLLDELIDAHERVAPKSLFAESVKDSIKQTANEFLQMMPAFARRLAQREYDFLLMKPVKRRMLLKMYCMGLFLNNRREKAIRQRLTVPYLEKVWRKNGPIHEVDELQDDGYYEDMYPAADDEPSTYRPETAIALDLMGLDEPELDDEMVLDAAESWTHNHPVSPTGADPLSPLPDAVHATPHMYTNLVFDADDFSDSSSLATSARSREHSLLGDLSGQRKASPRGHRVTAPSKNQGKSTGSQVSVRSNQYPGNHTDAYAFGGRELTFPSKLSSPNDHSTPVMDSEPLGSTVPDAGSTAVARDESPLMRPASGSSHVRAVRPAEPGSVVSLRSGGSRPSSGQSKQPSPEVRGSMSSLRSRTQVHTDGQDNDPTDIPTEFAV